MQAFQFSPAHSWPTANGLLVWPQELELSFSNFSQTKEARELRVRL